MLLVVDIVSWALIMLGSFFTVVGMLGLVRMPDVFTRMHAASVVDTLGAGLILVGLMLFAGASLVTAKLFFLILFFGLLGPVATHAVARAALHAGVKPVLAEGVEPETISGEVPKSKPL